MAQSAPRVPPGPRPAPSPPPTSAPSPRVTPAPVPRRAPILAPEKASCPTAKLVLLRLRRCCPGEAWPAAEWATAAELRALALKVELVVPDQRTPTRTRQALASLARRRGACGALRIARRRGPGGGLVTVALIDRATGKTTYRDLPLPRSANAAHIVALRVVELLRASLIELRMVGRPRPRLPHPVARLTDDTPLGRVGPPPRRRPRPRPPARPLAPHALRLDLSAVGSPGEISALGQLRLAYRYALLPWLSLETSVATSVVRADLRYDDVSSSFDVAIFAAWAHWELLTRGRFRASVGLGGGVMVPWAVGQESVKYVPQRDVSLSGYLAGTLQGAVGLTRRVWIRLSFEVGAAVPEIRVEYAGQVAARFGHPFLAGHLGLELRLP